MVYSCNVITLNFMVELLHLFTFKIMIIDLTSSSSNHSSLMTDELKIFMLSPLFLFPVLVKYYATQIPCF